MLLSLSQYLMSVYPEQLGFLRVIQYLTFRSVLAALTSSATRWSPLRCWIGCCITRW